MNKNEYLSWKEHPVTEEMIRALTETREGIKEELASGATLDSHEQTARYVGNIEGLDFFINHRFEDELE